MVLLELELSELFLTAQWVGSRAMSCSFSSCCTRWRCCSSLSWSNCLCVSCSCWHAWQCGETRATGFLLPQLVKLSLRVIEVLGALEILKLCALGECVDVFLLGRVRPLCRSGSVAAQRAVEARSKWTAEDLQ